MRSCGGSPVSIPAPPHPPAAANTNRSAYRKGVSTVLQVWENEGWASRANRRASKKCNDAVSVPNLHNWPPAALQYSVTMLCKCERPFAFRILSSPHCLAFSCLSGRRDIDSCMDE